MPILPSQKKVAVLTRWLCYRGGPKTGFHCTCLHRCKSCHGRFEYNVGWYISVIIHVSVSNPSPLNTAFFLSGNASILTFSSEFFISSYPLKWNCGIYENFTLTNTTTIFVYSVPYKIQSFIFSWPKKRHNLPCPSGMLFFSMLMLGRIHCVTSKGMFVCEARSWDYFFINASPLSVSLSFTSLKLFLYTQSAVCILYLVLALYSVRSF